MILKNFNYYRPQTIKEAQELMDRLENPLILAGGTFVLTFLKNSSSFPKDIIGLKNIKELTAIKKEKEYISIGSMVTLDDLCRNELVTKNFPILKEAILEIATPQIRNMASIGGNICSGLPWSDLAYLLLALDAELAFLDKKISLNEFLNSVKIKNESLLKEIKIPLKQITKHIFIRVSRLNSTDIPQGGVCIIEIEGKTRVSLNLGNKFAKRFNRTEEYLNKEKNLENQDNLKKASEVFLQELSLVENQDYQKQMFLIHFKRALEKYAKL